MRNSVFSFHLLLSSVFLLSVASFSQRLLFFLAMHRVSAECGSLLSWLSTSQSEAFASVWWSPLTQSRASSTSGADSSAAYLCVELFTLSYHCLSQARPLEICNIEPGDCAAVCSRSGIKNRDLAANHHRGHLCFSRDVWGRCGSLRDLDLFLNLRLVDEFPGCRHFILDSFCRDANFGFFSR